MLPDLAPRPADPKKGALYQRAMSLLENKDSRGGGMAITAVFPKEKGKSFINRNSG